MKNILIIIADYEPIASSNTNCIEPYLKGLESSGWNLDIITRRAYRKDSLIWKETQRRTIYRINDFKLINTLLSKEMVLSSPPGILRKINNILTYVSRCFYYLRYAMKKYETYAAGWNEKEMDVLLKKLSRKRKYKFVLSISYPEKTHEIAKNFIEQYQPECKWILLEYDPFYYNRSNYKRRYLKKLLSIQKENFNKCFQILCTPQLNEFYQTTPLQEYGYKMYPLEYANLQIPDINYENVFQIKFDSNKINCLFCGVLKKGVRDPEKLFSLFLDFPDQYKLCIMTGSNLKAWEQQIVLLKEKIEIIEEQTRDTAYDCMSKADILINIGNSVPYQIPGKIFEYMSFGKPIIHISTMKTDPCLRYFKHYPFAFVIEDKISGEDLRKSIQTFYEYCESNKYNLEKIKEEISEFLPEQSIAEFVQRLEN